MIDAALQNPHLTEPAIIKQLTRGKANKLLADAICDHPKWKLRTEIIAALRDGELTEPAPSSPGD